jgi:PAS domain S-box-containing protein
MPFTIKSILETDRQANSPADVSPAAGLSMLTTVFDQSIDCIKLLDADGRLLFMTRNGQCAMEIDDFEAVKAKTWCELWPVETRDMIRSSVESALQGNHTRFTAFCPTAKGSPRWWDVSVSPVKGEMGQAVSLVSISRDVSEMMAAKQSLETLAFEMRHRLKNAYAVSAALAKATARDSTDVKQLVDTLATRLSMLASAQGRILDLEGGALLRDIVEDLVQAFSSGASTIVVDGSIPAIQVSAEMAKAIALVIGELAVNSVKHGALKLGAQVSIRASVDAASLKLLWSEHGAILAGSSPPGHGAGVSFMERIATLNGGQFSLVANPDAIIGSLELPLKNEH